MGPDLRGTWMLFMWTCLVVKLLKFLALAIYLFFSSGADPQRDEGVGVTHEGFSSMSIGELWPDIDKLDEIDGGDTSAVNIAEVALHEKKSLASIKKANKHARRGGKGALLNNAPGPYNVLQKGRRMGFANEKLAQILSNALGAVSLHMRRPFVDKWYSPSIGMEPSEWEIILHELTRMGYIVKKNPIVTVMNKSCTHLCCYCCEILPSHDSVVRYRLHAILLWYIAFMRFCFKISPSCDFVMKYRIRAILL
jgi:hypothetical protein